MSNLNPLSNSVSLDDLLKANKQQFDRIFTAQMQELGRVATRPPSSTQVASDLTRRTDTVYDMLNSSFGSRWTSEVIEHRVERDAVTVLCKLTVDGVSKMQFGSGRIDGEQGAALQRATEAALQRCAAMFGVEAPGPERSTLAPSARGIGRGTAATVRHAPVES